ncbi:MAG TPA: AmmeMemoRadiSam system protein B [Chloroflexota bacterium]|nr:AmmeMemoRadiSam system protein B [Chloroflexota bacterium]
MESFNLDRPRLRPLELKWVQRGAEQVLFMRDPSGVAPRSVYVPAFVAILLGFCDGERDAAGIRGEFESRTGQSIGVGQVEEVLRQLDELLFLDSPRFRTARDGLIHDYRAGSSRPAALAGRVYPAEPAALLEALQGYGGDGWAEAQSDDAEIRGIVSPHIDYQRGGPIYAATWQLAREAVELADLVIIFGTDHCGGPGQVTLTRQSYATPLGVLPTALDVVDAVAEAIGPEEAFAEELHHRNEHSVELAAVWLHSLRRGDAPRLVPILCGSFHHFSTGQADPQTDERFAKTIAALQTATHGRKVLVVAAADLAHVGPAFGDSEPYQDADRRRLAEKDESLLRAICEGDAPGFFAQLRAERDSRRVCGLPPIYLTLRFLGTCHGEVVGYDQCPADPEGGSLVSIGGVLLK